MPSRAVTANPDASGPACVMGTYIVGETPDRAEQRALARKVVAREHDQVLRMWMPYDSGFQLWQPHLRNIGQLDLRGNFGYGSSTLARLWIDK